MRSFFLTLLVVIAAIGAHAAETYTGVITDTMCGAKPHTMMKDHTPPECVRMCIKGPYVYALFDGATVMKLSDQKTSAKYAARRVRVTGTYDEKSKTIKVASIEPLDEN
jgi:hypothetical protein